MNAAQTLPRLRDRPSYPPLTRGVAPAVDQVLRGRPEDAGDGGDGRRTRSGLRPACNLSGVSSVGLEPSEAVDLVQFKQSKVDERGQPGGEIVRVGHDDGRSFTDEQAFVKRRDATVVPFGETAAMAAAKKDRPARPDVAQRVRARIAELGTTESAISLSWGKDRTLLSTVLRGVEKDGRHIRDDLLQRLAMTIGKTPGWIFNGVEEEGVRLRDVPGWEAAASEAADRFGFPADAVAIAGDTRLPSQPRRMDAATVEGYVRAWMNTR